MKNGTVGGTYTRAMGHISRKYYLNRFEPGVVSVIDEAEYQKAYKRRMETQSEGEVTSSR